MATRTHRLSALRIAAVLGFLLAAAQPVAADILIAVAGPMTGQFGPLGQQMKVGALKAVENLNARGGVLGQKLVLEVGDDLCDAQQAVAVANQLVGKGVKFVAGHLCSTASIAAAQVYAGQGIIQISPGSMSPRLTDNRAGPGVFRIGGRDDQQGQAAGKFLAEHFRDKNVAIVHDNSVYGRGLADETRKALNGAGKKERLYDAYPAGEKDYTALVARLKAEAIDAVYVGGYPGEAGLILRQMRNAGMRTVLVSGDALATEDFWSLTGAAGEGAYMTLPPDPRKTSAAAPVVEALRRSGVEPEGYVLPAYAAVQTWAQAVAKAGSVNADKVIQALNGTEFETVIGKFRFDAKGDATLPGYVVYVWKDGNYDYLQP